MANQQQEIYYLLDEKSSTVFWTDQEEDHPNDLIFIGSSINPNKKMSVAAFMKGTEQTSGYKIKELI